MKVRAFPLLLLLVAWSGASGQHPEYIVEAELYPNEIDAFFEHLESWGIDGLRDIQRTHLIESLEPNAATSFEIQIRRDSAYRTIRLRAQRGDDDTVTLRFTTYSERFADDFNAMVRRYLGEDEPVAPDPTS